MQSLRSMIPLFALGPTYFILGKNTPEDRSKLNERITKATQRIFFSGLFCLSLYTNPIIFYIGAWIGLLGSQFIDKHIVQEISQIWKNCHPVEKMMMVIVQCYLEYQMLWPAMSLYSSLYIFSRIGLARRSKQELLVQN